MAISIHGQPPKLVDLPTEVLVEIFDLVPDKNLSTVRLVCKRLCDAATPRFATVNFTERIHVASPYSISALIKITEHPVFGGYVKTNKFIEEDDCDAYRNVFVQTGSFAHCMERVFGNIRSRTGSVAIGIYDNPGIGNLTRLSGTGSVAVPMKCYGWNQLTKPYTGLIVYWIMETFEQTVFAARRVRCPVERLMMGLCEVNPFFQHKELDVTIHKILESNSTPLSLDVGREPGRKLSYRKELQRVELQKIDLSERTTQINDGFELPLKASHAWLITQKVSELNVSQSGVHQAACLGQFLTPSLRCLELSKMFVSTRHFDSNLWSEYIQTISSLSALQHCKLNRLAYRISLTYDLFDRREYIWLPDHGRYTYDSNVIDLAFHDGQESVEMTGDDVCEQLKELACYVAAAEAQRLQRIVNDGHVDWSVVSMTDTMESLFEGVEAPAHL
ncbi:hypothetical protein KCU83_g3561, partial [Aureobasidium melanogenum]